LTKSIQYDSLLLNEKQGGSHMPIRFKIPPEKEKMIEKFAKKAGMTTSVFILSAVDEKLGLSRSREQNSRELAGRLSHEEANELREAVNVFSQACLPLG